MDDQSWVVDNLKNALTTWNGKLNEIWTLLTVSPQSFKGGGVWGIVTSINSALLPIAYGLLVLFFAMSVCKTCGSLTEIKRPEHALRLFIRFALAKAAVTYCMELLTSLFTIAQGIVAQIIGTAGLTGPNGGSLPQELIDTINACGFWESIPLWAVTLLGSLFITVMSFIMILTVYGRFFPAVHVHGHCTGAAICLCRRNHQPQRQSLCAVLSRRLSGGGHHRAGLHHLFLHRCYACGQRGSHPHYGHLGLCERGGVWSACAGGNHQGQRPHCEGYAGAMKYTQYTLI